MLTLVVVMVLRWSADVFKRVVRPPIYFFLDLVAFRKRSDLIFDFTSINIALNVDLLVMSFWITVFVTVLTPPPLCVGATVSPYFDLGFSCHVD